MARRSDYDQLEALLDGQSSSDDAPRPLSRLAGLATAVRDHTELETPDPAFRARLRAELLDVAAAGRPTLLTRVRDRVDTATARVRHSMRAAGAAALASSMIGTVGVAAAAQSALPGDVLYSIKGLTEDARLAFTAGDVQRGRLHLAFARERLEEVELGRDRLSPEQLTATLALLDDEAAAGADDILQAVASADAAQEALGELDVFTAEMRSRLIDLTPDLPLSVQPAAERTLEVLRRIEVQVAGLVDLAQCADCGEGLMASLPRVVLPGDGPAAPACQCVPIAPASGELDGTGSSTGSGDDGAVQPTVQPVEPPDDGVAPSDGTGTLPSDDPIGDGLVDGVDDVGSAVDDAVDDVGSIVDDIVEPPETPTGGVGGVVDGASEAVDDTTELVDDTASELGDVVDDATSEVEDVVDDLTGGL